MISSKTEGRTTLRHSLAWRMVLPVPLIVVAAIALIGFTVPRMTAKDATEGAVAASRQIATQFKILRAYYTENVVGKAVKDG